MHISVWAQLLSCMQIKRLVSARVHTETKHAVQVAESMSRILIYGQFPVDEDPAVSDSGHTVKSDVVHEVMLMDVLQGCHDTGDKAAQLCSASNAPAGSILTLTEQLLLRRDAFLWFDMGCLSFSCSSFTCTCPA